MVFLLNGFHVKNFKNYKTSNTLLNKFKKILLEISLKILKLLDKITFKKYIKNHNIDYNYYKSKNDVIVYYCDKCQIEIIIKWNSLLKIHQIYTKQNNILSDKNFPRCEIVLDENDIRYIIE
jgi:hypothetical protein